MQNFTAPITAQAQALAQAAAAEPGVRELTLSELALVSGGLPRGGWAPACTLEPTATMGVESLPRGGW